jgi:hypothetical protein
MNIEGLSTQEKSVLLAKAAGWRADNLPLPGGVWKRVIVDENGIDLGLTPLGSGVERKEVEMVFSKQSDLYRPNNMPLAWRIMNELHRPLVSTSMFLSFEKWWECANPPIWWLEPADAQAAWLDKILSLAIEAGIVKVEQ